MLFRSLRYGIGHDGRPLFPFMPFQTVSDEDITAVISYLRSQPPVKNVLKKTEYSFMGKAIVAFGLIKPEWPKVTPPKTVVKDSSITYGKYLADNVANCQGCHTERDLMTGEFTGPFYAGGLNIPSDPVIEGLSFVTPNLTPDPETGVMAAWTENAFINRFRSGRVHKSSPMPWGCFSRMDEIDLKALYRYLQSLAPVKRKVEKTVLREEDK